MSNDPGPVLQVSDLHVRLSRAGTSVHAVRGVDLTVQPGEVVGLVGQSGSGKSVLGLGVMGLLPSSAQPQVTGGVQLAGTDMLAATDRTRREVRREHVGAVFQDPMTSLDPTMTVGNQLREVSRGDDHSIELLESVGVPRAADRLRAYPHQLSGGLRQRVMIALAVARRPSLILADEPTTALDVTVQAQVLELLLQMRDDLGCGIVFVTHDLGVASQVCDRVAVMREGTVVETGETDAVLHDPVHPYTQGLLTSRISLTTPRDRPLAVRPEHPARAPQSHGTTLAPAVVPGGAVAVGADGVIDTEVGVDRTEESLPPVWPEVLLGDEVAVRVSGVQRTFRSGPAWRRRELRALRGVDLELRRGESVAIVGESGCGKSTLLRIVAGLERADAGSVELVGSGGAQMVFQDAGSSLTPWLPVGTLLDERLRAHLGPTTRAERSDRVRDALRAVGLPDVEGARPAQLSGGQRQRVAIARAIIVPPTVLLCDEPTSALDVSVAATVLNMLGRLRRELRMSMLFVTHDLAAARIVADRIVVMREGEVVESGPADEVSSRPSHPYTRELLDAVPGEHRRRRRPSTTTSSLGGAA